MMTTQALFRWKNIITHHPITQLLSLKNPQTSPKPGLTPKLCQVFKSKNSKMCDPHSDLGYQCSQNPYPPLPHPTYPKTQLYQTFLLTSLLCFNANGPLLNPHLTAPMPLMVDSHSSSLLVPETKPTTYVCTSFLCPRHRN